MNNSILWKHECVYIENLLNVRNACVVMHVLGHLCPGGGGLYGVSVPRVVPNVLLSRRETQPASLVHLRASFDPSLRHPQRPHGESG